jgi:hypothetical protein
MVLSPPTKPLHAQLWLWQNPSNLVLLGIAVEVDGNYRIGDWGNVPWALLGGGSPDGTSARRTDDEEEIPPCFEDGTNNAAQSWGGG